MDERRRTRALGGFLLGGVLLLGVGGLLSGALAREAAVGIQSPVASTARTDDPGSGFARYYLLPESRLEVLARTSGLLSFMGDDHRIRAGAFGGMVVHDPRNPTASWVEIHVPVDSLVVLTPVDSADRAEIRERMIDEVLVAAEHPEISFLSTRVEPVVGTLLVEGRLAMKGRSQPVVVGMTTQVRGDTLLAQGRLSVRLSDYDIERPGVAWGAVKVDDRVDIDLYVRALRQGARVSGNEP